MKSAVIDHHGVYHVTFIENSSDFFKGNDNAVCNCCGSDRERRKAICALVAVYKIFWVKTPPKSD